MKQYTATANDDGVRLSRFVQSVTRDFPTSLLYKSFRNKRVKVNGKKAVPEYRIQAGDLIELYINDEFFPPEGAKTVQKAAPKKKQNQPKVNVIYEDENIAVLYKPTHLLCHSDRTGDDQAQNGDVHHLGHLDGLGDNHAHQILGGGDHHDAVHRQGLEHRQGHIAGSGGHIHKQVVHVAPDEDRKSVV